MNKTCVLILLFVSEICRAEVYDSKSELHDDVLVCGVSKPYEYRTAIYLDRDTFVRDATSDEIAESLLKLDLRFKADTLNLDWSAERKVSRYNHFNYAKAAECFLNSHIDGDRFVFFNNTKITPSQQMGYVVLRKNKVIARVLTEARYID